MVRLAGTQVPKKHQKALWDHVRSAWRIAQFYNGLTPHSSCSFPMIDFRGFDPSHLTDLFYTFSGCSHLTTIYADSTWALPSSGISGSQCFYSCSTSLVGGNGTVWASSKTGYTYFRIDAASTPGYITAA